tara:strand:+ start:1647 stop:2597 length:951 start_codon:yes stop_codon:yes gene_type:complete
MPAAFLGRQSFLYIGQEVDWGIEDTPTVYTRVIDIGLQREQERAQKTHLSTSAAAFSEGSFDAMELAGGSFGVPILYDGSGILLYNALGATPVTTADGALFNHVYKPSSTLPSITIKVQRGDATSETFIGCTVSTMSLSIAAGEELTASFDVVAKTANARAAALPSPSFGSGGSVLHFQAGSLSYNAQTYNVRSIELNLDNKVERRDLLGSKLTAQPAITDTREIKLSVTADYEDDNIYNAQLAGTISDVVIEFVNAAAHIFEITLNDAQLISYNDNIDSVGRIERTFEFQGFANSSSTSFQIRIRNGSSSAVAQG